MYFEGEIKEEWSLSNGTTTYVCKYVIAKAWIEMNAIGILDVILLSHSLRWFLFIITLQMWDWLMGGLNNLDIYGKTRESANIGHKTRSQN